MMISGWLLGGIEALLESTLVLVLAWLLALVLRRASGQVRYLVWSAALVGVLLLPILSPLMPSWRQVDLPAPLAVPAVPFGTVAPSTPDGLTDVKPATGVAEVGAGGELPVTLSWEAFLLGLWGIGVLLVLARVGWGWWRTGRLTRRARPLLAEGWWDLLAELQAQLAISRPVRLRRSTEVSVPMSGGWLRPVVFMPPEADSWSAERRRVVLLHELLHVKRGDGLVHFLAQLSSALYWFHPLVWLARHRLAVEREEACDEAMIERGTKPSDYATHLLEIADALTANRRMPAAAMAMIHHSQLEGRLMSILNTTHPRHRSAVLMLSVMLGLVGLVLLLATTQLRGEPAPLPAATPAPTSEPDQHDEYFPWNGTGQSHSRIGFLNGDFVIDRSFDDGLRLRQRVHGNVKLDDDATAILHLDPDAYMVLATGMPDSEQWLKVTTGDNGQPRYDWTVNGEACEFDALGRQWLKATLLVVADYRAISEIRAKAGTLRGKIGTIRGEKGTLRGKIGTIRGQEGTLRAKIGTIRAKAGTLRAKIGTIRAQIGILRAERARLRDEDASEEEIDRVNERIARSEEKIRETEEEIRELDVEGRVKAVEEEIRALDAEGRIAELERQIAELDVEGRIAELERQIEELDVEGRVAEIEQQIKELRAEERVGKIEAQLAPKYEELRRLVAQLAE